MAAVDAIAKACLARESDAGCLDCGGKWQRDSPGLILHDNECSGLARFDLVWGLLSEAVKEKSKRKKGEK
jgi:hypothetical protein